MSNETNIFVETNTDCNAMGSVTWDCNGHHVVFSIYGPKETKQSEELTHRGFVDILVAQQTGQKTAKVIELELYLNGVLERIIDVKDFPRCKIPGRLYIVTGSITDPRTVASALNAASLACILSGLPLKTTIATVCLPIDRSLLAITVDVTDHKLSVTNCASHEPSIFSVYTGIGDQDSRSEISMDNKNSCQLGFSIDKFLDIIKIPTMNSDNDDFCFKSSFIYKSAMDLMDVMASQIVSCAVVK